MIRDVSITLLCFAFGFVLVAILTLLRRKDIVSIRFLMFSVMATGWGFFSALWFSGSTLENTYNLQRCANIFSAFIPATWIHFIFTFIDKKEPFKNFYLVLYGYSITLTILCLNHLYIDYPTSIGLDSNAIIPKMAFNFLTLSFVTIVPYGFYHLVRNYQKATGVYQKQLLFLILATLLGFTGGGWTFLPVYFRELTLIPVHLAIFYPIFMGVALVRYNLFSEEDFVLAAHKDKLAFMGTLSSSINHEIRNPLYIVQGTSESFLQNVDENLIPENEWKEKALKIIRESKNQISRALDIVASFSNLTKTDSASDEKTEVTIKALIEHVLSFVKFEASKKQIKINVDIKETSLKLMLQQRQFEQVILNLLLNAIQAFEKPEGEIKIHADRNEGRVILSIQDNGPGMPKKQLDQIFEPFYTTKEEGTGLGLYITKQLVERNGGTIRVESEEGHGTKFTMEFDLS